METLTHTRVSRETSQEAMFLPGWPAGGELDQCEGGVFLPHSIVCHRAVCSSQINAEPRDTLLLIGQRRLTAPAQHMAAATSCHLHRRARQDGQYLPSIIQQFSWPF